MSHVWKQVRLWLTGRAGDERLSFEDHLARLAVLEEILDGLRRIFCGAISVGLAALAWSALTQLPAPLVLDGGWVRSTVSYVSVFLLGQHLAGRRKSPSMLTLLVVVLAVAAGWAALTAVLCSVLGAAVGAPLSSLTTARLLVGPGPTRTRLSRFVGSSAGRETWRAAEEARRISSEFESQLWREIVDDARESPALRAGAIAALVELDLGASNLQQAVARADAATDLLRHGGRTTDGIRARVAAAAGRAYLAAGDRHKAADLLELAVTSRAYRTDPLVRQAWEESSESADVQGGRLIGRLQAQVNEAVRAKDAEHIQELIEVDLDSADVEDAALRHSFRLVASRTWVELGNLRLEAGDHEAAVKALRRATTGLGEPATAVELAVARALLGAALSRTDARSALAELTEGVRALEARRGTLVDGIHRSGLIVRHAAVYRQVLAAVAVLQRDEEHAGWLAAEVIESLRRGSLATMLRSGGSLDLGEQLQSLLRRLTELESGEGSCADPTAELAEVRSEIADEYSALAASTYVPAPVQARDLIVGARHVVAYHLDVVEIDGPDHVGLRGHLVWTAPGAEPLVTSFAVEEPALLELAGAFSSTERRAHLMAVVQDDRQVALWARLAEALLPEGLRVRLEALADGAVERLVIVPHGLLAALPWAALRLADGRPLLVAAELQVAPSLAILSAADQPRTPDTEEIVVHLAEVASGAEQRTLAALPARRQADRAAFLDALSIGPAGAYIAAHGDEEGLAQTVAFGSGGGLSAAVALGHGWPPWVVFASCLVGRVDFTLGAEPLGLPISCLIRGADTVIGGVIEVGYAAEAQAARVAARLHAGEHPATALRDEQLRQYRKRPDAPLTAWAGYICISRLGRDQL